MTGTIRGLTSKVVDQSNNGKVGPKLTEEPFTRLRNEKRSAPAIMVATDVARSPWRRDSNRISISKVCVCTSSLNEEVGNDEIHSLYNSVSNRESDAQYVSCDLSWQHIWRSDIEVNWLQ
ncbi:hypothetical protein ACH5RR_025581 [Cinchona calisaya]|uniref:Uncharacterized protein n=1 Tax=Cinchona calisaya TaxID=153742 RepID=A0ABD2Z021_9GENT